MVPRRVLRAHSPSIARLLFLFLKQCKTVVPCFSSRPHSKSVLAIAGQGGIDASAMRADPTIFVTIAVLFAVVGVAVIFTVVTPPGRVDTRVYVSEPDVENLGNDDAIWPSSFLQAADSCLRDDGRLWNWLHTSSRAVRARARARRMPASLCPHPRARVWL